MMRRNILVERNRRRQEHYAPIRKALEEEDLRLAAERQEEKNREAQAWRDHRRQTSLRRPDRPLPGGGPRSQHHTEATNPNLAVSRQQEKLEQKKKEIAYQKLYEADMRQQLADRHAVLQKQAMDEQLQLAELRRINEDQFRQLQEEAARKEMEQKLYRERLHKLNVSELERKRQHQLEQHQREEELMRVVRENNAHQQEMTERQQKNVLKMMQLQNEEALVESMKNCQETEVKNAKEVELMIERDRRLAKEEREAEEAKRERFRREFDECVRADREFRRIHNYDEPIEVTRAKNEQAAESYRLLKQEEAWRMAEDRRNYQKDLLKQIKRKQEYELRHFDDA